jgi:hypothetical protein
VPRRARVVGPLDKLKIVPDPANAELLNVTAAWEEGGELLASVPVSDPALVRISSLILPQAKQGDGLADRMYEVWTASGGRVQAIAPLREFPFLKD